MLPCSGTLVRITPYSKRIHVAQDKNGKHYNIIPGYIGTVDAGMGEERENEG